ncbi:MAG: hypothetical protein KatS3mg080_0435 [Anoxybacillus sp.]|nr:MAG: hypothetical protein KatS3mg080_0435 [Anoxybacillus sp.]
MHEVVALMAGNVWKIVVQVGDVVEEGQDVVILESMKMEIPVASRSRWGSQSDSCTRGRFRKRRGRINRNRIGGYVCA